MHKNIMTQIKKYVCKVWIALDAIIKHSIKIFECLYKENKWHKKVETTSSFMQTKSLFLDNTSNNC